MERSAVSCCGFSNTGLETRSKHSVRLRSGDAGHGAIASGSEELGAMRILVVEDDRALAKIITRGLVEEGHAVDTVHTLKAARLQLEVSDVALIVLDLGLPDGSGIDFCLELRGAGNSMKVLMLTARDGVAERILGLNAGADDYLPKPFDFGELGARVRALLRRPNEVRNPQVRVGSVVIDSPTRRVLLDGAVVPLTTREFALLHHLANQLDAVVSRTELIDALWDSNYDGVSNVVDVHVRSLRRKLDRSGSPLPLETIRGAGYRLRSDNWAPEADDETNTNDESPVEMASYSVVDGRDRRGADGRMS
jgi:DNA-binding response OmpR family regulator